MTLDGLRVNHAGLDLAARDLADGVRKIDNRLGRLETELAPLRSDWTGEAQRAYVTAQTTWATAMQEMRDLLQETSVTVDRSNAAYRAADLRGASSFEF